MYGTQPPINWESIYLTENPFPQTPPTDPHRVHWAGMPDLRRDLESVLREAITSGRKQFVLNRGVLGGGKTHASLYYKLPERMPDVEGERVRKVWYICIQLPKQPATAVEELYRLIIEQLTLSQARKNFRHIVNQLSRDDFLETFRKSVGSEELALALWKFGSSDDEDEQGILKRYFLLSGCTKTELKKLQIAREISSLLDQIGILTAFIESFVGIDSDTSPSHHDRVILWVDECEDLLYFTAREHRPFTQTIRGLIDSAPSFFTIFMNFTMTRPEREAEVDAILGGYIMRRVTHIIKFDELTPDEVVEYIAELLKIYRLANAPGELPPCYPFDREALVEVTRLVPTRSPGYVNKLCYDLLLHAFEEKLLPGDSQMVNAQFVSEYARRMLSSQSSQNNRLP